MVQFDSNSGNVFKAQFFSRALSNYTYKKKYYIVYRADIGIV